MKYLTFFSKFLSNLRKSSKNNDTTIVIDGPNTYHAQKRTSLYLDYIKVKNFFAGTGNVRMIYFDSGFPFPSQDDIERTNEEEARRILRILAARENRHSKFRRLGMEVIVPPDGKKGIGREENSDIDVDIGIGQMIIHLALDPECGKIVLGSGDGRHFAGFLFLAKEIAKTQGKKLEVEVFSGKQELSPRFEGIVDRIHIIEETDAITEVK